MGVNKRYYWLKLKEDFFKDKRIKRLRKIAGGDTYTIIYQKMLLLSLQDEGKLYFDNVEENFIEELALELDEDEDNVQVTVSYLKQKGLLEVVGTDEYYLTDVPCLIGSETASARRVRKHRKENAVLQSNTKTLQCNTDVTSCNKKETESKSKSIDKELELYKDIEVELELELNESNTNLHNNLVDNVDNSKKNDIDYIIKSSELKCILIAERIDEKTTDDIVNWLMTNEKDVNYLVEKIEIAKEKGKVKDNVGYLIKAIKDNYVRW